MNKYKFTEPRRMDTLPNGRIRCYFNEDISEETISGTNLETGDAISETHNVYTYDAVDIDAPATKGTIVNALVRLRYSQADAEAIMRHSIAGAEGADVEFAAFNAYVEGCKAEADKILQVD